MGRLLRAAELVGLPVVTLAGESPFEIKDMVFDPGHGEILGFTLRKHGFLGQPVKEDLPIGDVHGLGSAAVMIASEDVLNRDHEFSAEGGDVIGDRIMTESGTDLGEVVEAVVSTGGTPDVVGFEVEPAEGLGDGHDNTVFIPLPDTMAVSGEHVIVPDTAKDYVHDDLTGFGGAVRSFRDGLRGEG